MNISIKEKIKGFIIIACVDVIVMLLCISSFVVMNESLNWSKIIYAFVINFIPFILITWGDYMFLYKMKQVMPNHLVLGWILSTIVTIIVVFLFAMFFRYIL